MAVNADAYYAMLRSLMPTGFAWSEQYGAMTTHLLKALAQQLTRIDLNAKKLEMEFLPETSTLLIDEWELALGLPECNTISSSLHGRQLDAYAKETAHGGMTPWYYEALAAKAGFSITIAASNGHDCEDDCEDAVTPFSNGLAPIIHSFARFNRWATCADDCITPIRLFGDGRLECLLNTYKPADTLFVYAYTEI